MDNFLLVIFVITLMTEIALGIFANVFIVLVNCADCRKRTKISLADRILTALAVSRIGLLWTIIINLYSAVINPLIYSKESRCVICIVWAVTQHANTWLVALLSVLYLLKIANFSQLIFLHLKRNVKKVLVVLLLSNFMFFVPIIMMKNVCEEIAVNELDSNLTCETKIRSIVNLTVLTTFTLGNVIPFIISLICFLLLIYSLCKHLRTMKLYGKGSQDASTVAHMKALQTVVSFLLLFVLFFLSVMVSVLSYKTTPNKLVHWICQLIGILYPSSHSFILIWGNKKLKQTFVLVIMKTRFWLKEQNVYILQ